MKKIWIGIVELFGWKYDLPSREVLPEVDHCVLIVAPHTSILDYLVGTTCLWKHKIKYHLFMKKEFFNWFTTPLLRHFGVVPIDRGNRKNHIVEQAVDHLNADKNLSIVLTPEGTRKPVKRWKRGFYEIATQANVPVCMAYIDFKKKVMGIMPEVFHPTGNFEDDMVKLKSYYTNITAKHPKNYIAQ